MVNELLDFALRQAGVPIHGVSMADPTNKSTWRVAFTNAATAAHRATAADVIATFNPADRTLTDAFTAASASRLISPIIRAFYLFWFRRTNGRDPTAQERQDDLDALVQALQDER
jgi:hypothetical protein